MSHHNSDRHPLAQRHFNQIVCRPMPLQAKMRSSWGLTWRPADHTSRFLGKLFRPIGRAVMQSNVRSVEQNPMAKKL
jgi:hypothetical protein